MPEQRILLYGLQRSGTNYLEALVKLNFDHVRFTNGEVRNNITHKHFRLYDEKEIIPEPQFANQLMVPDYTAFENSLPADAVPDLILVISKDPASWLASYNKWSEKNNWPEHAHHYLQEYQLFYNRWKEYSEQTGKILFIQYAALLSDPAGILRSIAEQLHQPLVEPVRTTKKVYASRTFTKKKKNAFLNRSHLSSPEELEAAVHQYITPSLRAFLNY